VSKNPMNASSKSDAPTNGGARIMTRERRDYIPPFKLGQKPRLKGKRYPMSWEDHKELKSMVYTKERPKGFLDLGGLVSLLDKAAQDCAEFADRAETPEEKAELLEKAKLHTKVGTKLWQLHEAGYGHPERICECRGAYVAKGKRFCAGCAREKRRVSTRNATCKWREKQPREHL
jgi:hypothetical protein